MNRDRRTILRTVGVGCVGALTAGCSQSAFGDDPTESESDEPTDEATDETESEPTGDEQASGDGDGEADSGSEGDGTDPEDEPAPDPGPRSAAHHDPNDGFADLAPWLEDDVPVRRVTEPTRAAVEEALAGPGAKVIAFETSGTVDLEGRSLSIDTDRTYLAGQTAPSPGITFVRGGLTIDANDCVVQHVRVRPGDAGYERGEGWEPDAINTGDGTRNNVVDHCSASWSVDECLSVGYHSSDTTVSNCLIAEPLVDSVHSKGPHGYGSLIGDDAQNVAMLGNVWAHATHRNPRLKTGTLSVVVNNAMCQFDEAVTLDDDSVSSVVGNAFLRVDAGDAVVEGGRAYVEDNVTDPDTPITHDVSRLSSSPRWPADAEAMPASDVLAHNLANAGARPADRTEHDARILENVRTGGGGYVDSQGDVGGYPDLEENERALDVPERGLRAWLREQALAVETTD